MLRGIDRLTGLVQSGRIGDFASGEVWDKQPKLLPAETEFSAIDNLILRTNCASSFDYNKHGGDFAKDFSLSWR